MAHRRKWRDVRSLKLPHGHEMRATGGIFDEAAAGGNRHFCGDMGRRKNESQGSHTRPVKRRLHRFEASDLDS
jgi:hypothetical protein